MEFLLKKNLILLKKRFCLECKILTLKLIQMKINYFTFILFFIFLNTSFAQTDEFTLVGSTNDGEEYYVLIQKTSDYATEIWVKKMEPIKTIKNKSGKLIKVGGGYNLTYTTIKCGDFTYDLGESITYYKNGNVKNNLDIDTYDIKVVPGSIMSAVFKYVCE